MNPIVVIFWVALVIRAIGAWMLGPGAFGPDAAGADAAVVLGGHPYPFHPFLIGAVHDARVLNVVCGAITASAAAWAGQRIDAGAWGPGLAVACAPLLIHHSAMAGGDAPAVAAMMFAVALAWNNQPLVGGAVAGLALGIKPIALPLLPLLFVAMPLGGPGSLVALAIGLGIGLIPTFGTLQPLLDPRPDGGLLGTWWIGNGGTFAVPGDWPALLASGWDRLWDVPTWAGHPILGGLALIGALLPGDNRKARVAALALATIGLLLTASLLGDRLHWRYLAPASVGLTILAGTAVRGLPVAALALLWPSAALLSALGGYRAAEEGLDPPPNVPFADRIDARPLFEDASVCGAAQLAEIAAELTDLPPKHEVIIVKLRDGREGDLTWPLAAARPDLVITRFHAGCCVEARDCSIALLAHAMKGATLIVPGDTSHCDSEVVGPAEQEVTDPLQAVGTPHGIWRVLTTEGTGRELNACEAMSP